MNLLNLLDKLPELESAELSSTTWVIHIGDLPHKC